jgi:hypothetical protein
MQIFTIVVPRNILPKTIISCKKQKKIDKTGDFYAFSYCEN